MKKVVFAAIMLAFTLCIFAGCGSASTGCNINSALQADDGTIDVVWDKVEGVDQLEIYRAADEDGEYSLIGTVAGDKTLFNDKDVKLHDTYWYKVRCESGGETSEYSNAVAAYVSDETLWNGEMTFEITFPEGDVVTGKAGDGGLGTNTYNVTIIPMLNGNSISDCKVYYDKSSLKFSKADAGGFDMEVLKPGRNIITFEAGKEKGTLEFAAEKMPDFDNEYFRYYWHQYNEETGLNDIAYPETKNSVLYMKHDGSYVSDVEAKSSDDSIATVKTSKGKVYVTNKAPGTCTIKVSSGENEGEITWVVRSGKALKQQSIGGVPISKNVDRAKAKKAINTITATDYSTAEMKKLAKEGLTLEEWQKKLSKPADVISMLRTLGFNDENDDSEKIDNDDVMYGGKRWLRKLSPEGNFKQRFLVCLSTAEMMNYLLRNDMEEQGYVEYTDPGGGHTFCYFKLNGLYVFCDFVDSIAGRDWPYNFYVTYVCEDVQEFVDYYVNGDEQNDPKRPGYITMMYMFPMEGRAIPAAEDESAYHIPGTGVCSILPEKWNGKDIKDLVTILYKAPGFQEGYAPGPPESEYPEK